MTTVPPYSFLDTRGMEAANGDHYGRQSPPVADVLADYLASPKVMKLAKNTRVSYALSARHINDHLGKKPICDLSARDCYVFHRALGDKERTANLALGLLSRACRWAEVMGWRQSGSDPCRAIDRYEHRRNERVFTVEQLRDILRAIDWLAALHNTGGISPVAASLFRFLLFTGCRRSEAMTLRHDEIDLERRRLVLSKTKTNGDFARVRPLSHAAIQVLRHRAEHPKQDPVWVFPGRRRGQPMKWPDAPWRKVLEGADIPHAGLHVLRHSFANTAAMLGIPRTQIGACLGHVSTSSTDRYLHLYGSNVVAEADRVANTILERREVS